jgi:hypothetical protein
MHLLVSLTDLTIRSLSPPLKGQRDYFDDSLAGFGVRINHGGTRSFFCSLGRRRTVNARASAAGIVTLAQRQPMGR